MLHIFTFATDSKKVAYLKQTANFHAVPINYILADRWTGYVDKINYMKKAIADISSDDIVCFIDAYDVLVNASEGDIIRQFRSYNCDLLIGAELNCYPENYRQQMDELSAPSLYKYINSGGYIGTNKAIKDMLYWKNDADLNRICNKGTDQAYVIEYYLQNRTKSIQLDIQCRFIQNMHWINWKELVIVNGQLYNTIMDATPCFIHFNGGTYQTNKRENIMPVIVKRKEETRATNTTQNLNDYDQLITATCFPHLQK